MEIPQVFRNLCSFYRDGFKNMTVGKTLWIVVLVKLFIMFVVLRIFFFPNYLNSNFSNKESKADHVRNELIKKMN